MLKALRSLGHQVDVLVGTGPDDFGAKQVFKTLRETSDDDVIGNIWSDNINFDRPGYDRAIMAIPYDGRWDFQAKFFSGDRVMDSRRRPGNVDRLGFDMWEKHEIEYQMDNARELGFSGPTPSCSFLKSQMRDPDLIYVGLGYKRDNGGFGASKHFGNSRYAAVMREIKRIRPQTRFVSTGGPSDMVQSWYQIVRELGPEYSSYYQFPLPSEDLGRSFDTLAGCTAYIGNDTGMMHVAASTGMPTFGLFAYADLMRKNPPFCDKSRCLLFTSDCPPVEVIAQQFVEFVWG